MSRFSFVFALPALLAVGCLGSPCGPSDGVVEFVVDGDTFQLVGSEQRYRLLLVDTPETTGGKNDCYGAEAKARFAGLVEGLAVRLGYDEAECTDRYSRTLTYVKVGETDVNASLVADGFACTLHIPPAGESRSAEFEELEFAARNARRGLWGRCADVTCGN